MFDVHPFLFRFDRPFFGASGGADTRHLKPFLPSEVRRAKKGSLPVTVISALTPLGWTKTGPLWGRIFTVGSPTVVR